MSETLSHQHSDPGPDTLGGVPPQGVYTTLTAAAIYPSQPATPSSTIQDGPSQASLSNLPPFSTFSSDIDTSNNSGGFGDTRLLDISNWDYYGEGLSGRLLERTEHGLSIISSQPQYRPWESKPIDSTSQDSLRNTYVTTAPINTFADAFASQSKLPSFQSQFQTFSETPNPAVVPSTITDSPTTLTTLTNLTPVSPSSTSPGTQSLTQLNPSNFHTLSTVNPRNYPLVPAPIQAREIPSIQQQFLEERHIQLYSHPTTAQLTNALHFPGQNGAIIQNNQIIHQGPTVVTVLKTEPTTNFVDLKLGANLTHHTVAVSQPQTNLGGIQQTHYTPVTAQFQNPMGILDHNNINHTPNNIGYHNGIEKKLNGFNNGLQTISSGSPTRNDFRKKERRKIRASSLESSTTESDGANSNMDIGGCENSGQVAAISSTAGFKSPHHTNMNTNMEVDEITGGNSDKQVKKKRKRCGECIGCQRKDNCGDCAPCRNDKSHQICKQRRCEKLTEKKLVVFDECFIQNILFLDTQTHDSNCTCCQATDYKTIRVNLRCVTGYEILKDVEVPSACKCLSCGEASFNYQEQQVLHKPVTESYTGGIKSWFARHG